jgi:hypothetical protein
MLQKTTFKVNCIYVIEKIKGHLIMVFTVTYRTDLPSHTTNFIKYLYVRNIIKVRCALLCAAIGASEEHVIDGIYC